jgi:hypothetical protein
MEVLRIVALVLKRYLVTSKPQQTHASEEKVRVGMEHCLLLLRIGHVQVNGGQRRPARLRQFLLLEQKGNHLGDRLQSSTDQQGAESMHQGVQRCVVLVPTDSTESPVQLLEHANLHPQALIELMNPNRPCLTSVVVVENRYACSKAQTVGLICSN